MSNDISLVDLQNEFKDDSTFNHLTKSIAVNESLPEDFEIKPFNLAYIKKNPGKKRINLLHPWLPESGLCMVYAGTGVGKTFFCLNAAYAVASGGNFLKFYGEKPVKVLYVDGEMSYDAMEPRISSVIKIQGDIHDDDNFLLVTYDQFPNKIIPKISTSEGQKFYTKLILDHKVSLVVLDNISTLTDLDENNADDWNIVQSWEIFLRSQGVSVVLVHHTGKNKRNQRGTSKREDILDTVILLEEIKGEDGEPIIGNQFKITFTKNRNFFGKDAEPFEAFLHPNGQWSMKTNRESTFEKVVSLTKKGMTASDIAIELAIKKSSIYEHLQNAYEKQLLIKQRGSKSKGRHWELNDD